MTWQCWGESAQYIDWGGEDNHIASAVIDRNTGLVYCLELFTGQECLRYLDPDFADEFIAECRAKDIDPDHAVEDVAWISIDSQTVLALLAQLNPGEPHDPT